MRLIDADALAGRAVKLTAYDEGGWGVDVKAVRVEEIDDAPTIDPESLRPVGRWERSNTIGFLRCSECRNVYINEDWLVDDKWHFCPNCGVKMEKEEPVNNIEIVRKHLDEPELLTQLAEEAAELAQAALKLRRVLTGVNPTPVTEEEARRQVQEELADVEVCMIALGYIRAGDMLLRNEISSRKWTRWAARLQGKEKAHGAEET